MTESNSSLSWLNQQRWKSRVLLSASYTSTVAEELAGLLRTLHAGGIEKDGNRPPENNNGWTIVIDDYMTEKLCLVPSLMLDRLPAAVSCLYIF